MIIARRRELCGPIAYASRFLLQPIGGKYLALMLRELG